MTSIRVVVVGGGIAGLTAATLLAEAGLKVTVLEADQSLGGLAKSIRVSNQSKVGFPAEHSLRVYHGVYSCYFKILKKIPFNEKETLFNQLTPISLALIYQDDFYVYHPKKKKHFYTNFYEQFKLMKFLRRQGFTMRDFLHLLKEYIYNRQCEERLTDNFCHLSTGEYLKNVSPVFWKIIYANYTMSYAGTRDTSALLATQMDTEGTPFSFFAMANGPTSEIIFYAWEKYLKKLGVEIKKETKVKEFIINNEKISAVKLESAETISADVFVCAVSDIEFPGLIQSAITQNKNTHFKNINFTEMWSHGSQFYLRDLPKTNSIVNKLTQPGVIIAHLHSPWKIVSVVQGKDFWKNVNLPDGCQYCISMTLTDASGKGLLYQKSFFECTPDEIRAELLHQTGGILTNDLIIEWHLDDAIVFMTDDEYQKKRKDLASHEAYHREDGRWILNFSPLYTPTPTDKENEPAARTEIANLYLAGSYCKTAMFIPTMEKACESGFLAAQAISKDCHLPEKIMLPFKSYNTKLHPVWRTIDAVFFKFQHWVKSQFRKTN